MTNQNDEVVDTLTQHSVVVGGEDYSIEASVYSIRRVFLNSVKSIVPSPDSSTSSSKLVTSSSVMYTPARHIACRVLAS